MLNFMNKNKILSGGGDILQGEGSGVGGGGKWGRGGVKWGERGREVGTGYPLSIPSGMPSIHPLKIL